MPPFAPSSRIADRRQPRNPLTTGLFAGTRIATPPGWRAVECLQPGDTVLGLSKSRLPWHRAALWHLRWHEDAAPDTWPVHIPAAALGNREAILLPAMQQLLFCGFSGGFSGGSSGGFRGREAVQSAQAGQYALLPAVALAGYRGITRFVPEKQVMLIQPELLQPALVRCGFGLWLLLPGAGRPSPELSCIPRLTVATAQRWLAVLMAAEVGAALASAPPPCRSGSDQAAFTAVPPKRL